MIEIDNLTMRYQLHAEPVHVLKGVDLTVGDGLVGGVLDGAAGGVDDGADQLDAPGQPFPVAVEHEFDRLVLPQLGAPGVAGHLVERRTGFEVVWGPVMAEDLPAAVGESARLADGGDVVLLSPACASSSAA